MTEYMDSTRLDAIGEHGLTVVCDHEMVDGDWLAVWRCHAPSMGNGAMFIGSSIREVIDAAIDFSKSQMN